jgi:hypothetical protein
MTKVKPKTSKYVTVTQAELATLVRELSAKLATSWTQRNPTQEVYHAWPVANGGTIKLEIRYYTSITPADEVARARLVLTPCVSSSSSTRGPATSAS